MDDDIFVDVGNGVHAGTFTWCNSHGATYPNVIHIWKPENLTEHRACQCVVTGQGNGLRVCYAEGQPIGSIDVPGTELIAYMRRPGNLLVHCAAGACRGPTITLLALIARGVEPGDAFSAIYRGYWQVRRISPTLVQVPVQDILGWWQANG